MMTLHNCREVLHNCSKSVHLCTRGVHLCTSPMYNCTIVVHNCTSLVHMCSKAVQMCCGSVHNCTMTVQRCKTACGGANPCVPAFAASQQRFYRVGDGGPRGRGAATSSGLGRWPILGIWTRFRPSVG
jgi:hypothetical protein